MRGQEKISGTREEKMPPLRQEPYRRSAEKKRTAERALTRRRPIDTAKNLSTHLKRKKGGLRTKRARQAKTSRILLLG